MRCIPLAVIGLLSCFGAPLHAGETIHVEHDRALIVRAPEGAQTLIIGNPMIADVNILRSGKSPGVSMIVVGRGFGTTNLIALDGKGNFLGETDIKVHNNPNRVLVMRGVDQESYACNPRCGPTVALGDTPDFMGKTIGAVRQYMGATQ